MNREVKPPHESLLHALERSQHAYSEYEFSRFHSRSGSLGMDRFGFDIDRDGDFLYYESHHCVNVQAMNIVDDDLLKFHWQQASKQLIPLLDVLEPDCIIYSGNSAKFLLPTVFKPLFDTQAVPLIPLLFFEPGYEEYTLYKSALGAAGEFDDIRFSSQSLAYMLEQKFGRIPSSVLLMDDYIGGATKTHHSLRRLAWGGIQRVASLGFAGPLRTEVISLCSSNEDLAGFMRYFSQLVSFICNPQKIEDFIKGDHREEKIHEVQLIQQLVAENIEYLQSH